MDRARVLQQQIGQPSLDVRDKVAIIYLNNPPLNALSYSLRTSILASLEKAENAPGVEVIVITGKNPRAFSAGADITEFSAEMKAPFLPEVIDQIEKSKKIVVAAVNGMALGGGCELALGCHYRVCDPKAFFGLPEIKLGLIPGAGGTQRLPRLVGLQNAIAMCCTGRNIKAPLALQWGLCDQVAEAGKVVEAAAAFGLELAAKKTAPRRTSEQTAKLGNWLSNKFIARAARQQVSKSVPPGMISPLRALDAVLAAASAPSFKAGMDIERKIFMELAQSPQAAAMQHFFFAERQALKIPGVPADVRPRPVKKVGVIGGGAMGGGIAMCFMNIGIPVTLLETADDRKKLCVDTIARNYSVTVAKGKMSQETMQQRLGLLTVVVNDFAAFQDVDYAIEAVFENMKLKKEIFAKLDRVCKPECILASNTSTLSIDEIASATTRPSKVIGAHFFSPANVMRLLEFVRGAETDAQTIVTSMAVGKAIKKAPVMVGNCFGFVSNRMMIRGGFQVGAMLEEGALPMDLDRVVKGFGFPMGVISMQDLAGLDVSAKIRTETPAHLVPKRDVTTINEELVKLGRFGQKSLKGYHLYDKENPRKPIHDPSVDKLIIEVSKKKGIKRRHIPDQEAIERYLFAMINEAAYILQEGFAIRPSDIDIVFIYGFGFPPYKGGPCHYADFIGIPKLVEAISKYHQALGPDTFPAPCPLLVAMAKEGKKFKDMNK